MNLEEKARCAVQTRYGELTHLLVDDNGRRRLLCGHPLTVYRCVDKRITCKECLAVSEASYREWMKQDLAEHRGK